MDRKEEYWRWSEGSWVDPGQNPSRAKVISAGIDVGSVSSEAVICLDGKLFASSTIRTGSSSPLSAKAALDGALKVAGLSLQSLHLIVGTGYGRVNLPFPHKTVTEIACHGKGAHYMGGPSVRTILDMGGQDLKVIKIDAAGRVTDFLMNDKCAAGTGRGIEVIADLLGVSIMEMGALSFEIDEEPPAVSDICVVFARSEAMARLKEGWSKNMVIASYLRAMAERVSMMLRRMGVEERFVITGGISKNQGVVKRIEKLVGVESAALPHDAQIAGALGAALFARDFYLKERASA